MRVSYGPSLGRGVAEENEVMFSCLGGYGLYVPTKETVRVLGGGDCRLVAHVRDGASFYALPAPAPYNTFDSKTIDHWRLLIERPPWRAYFLWPVDFVRTGADELLLIFPVEEQLSRWRPLTERLVNIRDARPFSDFGREAGFGTGEQAGLSEAAVLADNLLAAWSELHDAGYLYLGFDPSNVFFDPSDLSVRFGFSPSSCAFGGKGVADSLYTKHPLSSSEGPVLLSMDYVDPLGWQRVMQKKDADARGRPVADAFTEEFCIASVLFRLLVGRLPYYGPRVSFEPNGSASEHADWLVLYHSNPIFIFSESDSSNAIGGVSGFAEDDVFYANWESLPEAVREGFLGVFEWERQEKSRKLLKGAETNRLLEESVRVAVEAEKTQGHAMSAMHDGLAYMGPRAWRRALASGGAGGHG